MAKGLDERGYTPQDIKSAIADLQKGELIIKDNTMSELGLGGRKYKKSR